MAHQRTIFDVLVLAFFLPAVVQVVTSDVTCSSDNSQCAVSNNPSDLSGLIQMRVERSQDNDFIADNEELHGEDFDEDADLSDDDADLSDDEADLSDDDVEAQASEPKFGIYGTNSCPAGTVAMSEQECKDAAKALKKRFRKTRSYRNHPKGCMTRRNVVFYNTHATGKKNAKWRPLCTKPSPATTPPPQTNCGWSRHASQQCVGDVPGGSFFWGLAEAQKGCLDLGPSKCGAVTCRKAGQIETCKMRKCAELTRSGHGEVTYTPPQGPTEYPVGCASWTTHAFQKCDTNVAGTTFWGDLAGAKAKCLELGPCKCQAVTCRQLAFEICTIMPACVALTRSGHGEKTYKPSC